MLHGVALDKVTTSPLELYPKEVIRQVSKDVYFSECGLRTTSINIPYKMWIPGPYTFLLKQNLQMWDPCIPTFKLFF